MKTHKVLGLFFSICLLLSCAPSKYSIQKRERPEKGRERIIHYAHQQMGTPYKYGGSTPGGFDCSGFVQYVFQKAGYSLPRSTVDQSRVGKKVRRQDLRPGDLVFFKGRNKRQAKTGHVGIVVEKYKNSGFLFIHAASRGIAEDNSEETYWKERFLQARRISYLGD
ncbi:MAG: C40 family peptidase [Candidatus Azobacteroides sp.]|nr:C40 family peptidase [Candidatus Azobacteroides sp.]